VPHAPDACAQCIPPPVLWLTPAAARARLLTAACRIAHRDSTVAKQPKFEIHCRAPRSYKVARRCHSRPSAELGVRTSSSRRPVPRHARRCGFPALGAFSEIWQDTVDGRPCLSVSRSPATRSLRLLKVCTGERKTGSYTAGSIPIVTRNVSRPKRFARRCLASHHLDCPAHIVQALCNLVSVDMLLKDLCRAHRPHA